MQRPSLQEVLAHESAALLAMSGVLGTSEGIRNGEPVFVVFVERRSRQLVEGLPGELGGYRVEIRVPESPASATSDTANP